MNKLILALCLSGSFAFGSQIVNPTASGGGTINSGSANQVSYYAADGTTISGSSQLNVYASSVTMSTASITNLNTQIMAYRRPVPVFDTTSTVLISTGTDGTGGEAMVIFSDGWVYKESTVANIKADTTKKATWGSGTMQAGMRPTETITNNTWLSVYVVKSSATGNTSDFVVILSTWMPIQSNYATLNGATPFFGTNGWVYLGMVRYGDDSSSAPSAILDFIQEGNMTILRNQATGNAFNGFGLLLNSQNSPGTATFTYTYASGTGTTQIPSHLMLVDYAYGVTGGSVSGTGELNIFPAGGSAYYIRSNIFTGNGREMERIWMTAKDGMKVQWNASGSQPTNWDIWLVGFIDSVLGVGGNPLL